MNIGKNRTCVVYARIASHNSDDIMLLDHQVNEAVRCASDDWGLDVVGVVQALEAGTAAERDSIQTLYHVVEQSGAAYVFTRSPDRICRDQMGFFSIAQRLSELGIKRVLLPNRASIKVPVQAILYTPPSLADGEEDVVQ